MKLIASVLLLGMCLSGCTIGGKKGIKRRINLYPQSQGEQRQVVEMPAVLEATTIFFDFDSSALSLKAREILEKQVQWLASHPDSPSAILEGHCDKVGTREYNLALGERRAEQVKRYMVSRGISPERLEVRSYGKERLMNFGDSPEDQAENRRVVLVLHSK